MILAIVDLETTSADPATAAIVEIACCLFDTDHRIVTSAFSTTVQADENPAAHINGIPAAVLANATALDRAFATTGHFVNRADVLVAHNGDAFDRPILERFACPWTNAPWLDTMDVEWPRASTSRSLIQIAAAHGVPIGTVHRAIDDVLLVARLFERAAELGADLGALIQRAMRPKKLVAAVLPYDRKDEAKAKGFRWQAEAKRWTKSVFVDDIATLGFDVKEVA